ncbi:MAG: phosphoribosylanthranilate isomerase [Chloroflexi bacterium]|nr:MAG: phosphoribosylanthranilate isomerase [Chloroflexota bacterium]
MVRVKICGVTNYEDALIAAEAGADMLGLNFYKPSPRYIPPDEAATLCDHLRDELGNECPVLVGVFVNEVVGVVSAIMDQVGLDFAQLSGDESDEMAAELRGVAFKSIRPRNKDEALDDTRYYMPHFPEDERVPSLLLDAYRPNLYGGTGEEASIEVAQAVKNEVPRLMLAGGLTPENVADRIAAIQPWGVDVASGVELPGDKTKKDASRIRTFVEAVHSVDV